MEPRRRNSRPIDAARLQDMALAYVARFATTRARLLGYLERKVRERGWEGDVPPDIENLADQMVAKGFVDDAAYARARSGSLLRRGYGARRVSQALGAAGVDQAVRDGLRPDEAQQRQAALALARKRRFGPFSREIPDRARREKQLAAMLRAGHSLDTARELVDASSIEAAQDWAADCAGGDPCD